MLKARATLLLVLSAAAVFAGCEKTNWNWWKKPEPAPRPAPAFDPNLAVSPQEANQLKSEIAALRSQVEELKVRDRQMTDHLKELRILNEGQERMIKDLADAPGERDKARAQVEALKAEIELLRAQIRLLKGEAAPATQESSTQPASTTAPAGP